MRATNNRPWAVTAVVLGICILGSIGCSVSTYDQGRRALDRDDLVGALDFFEQAIAEGQNPLLAQRGRAIALLRGGDLNVLSTAIDDLEQVSGARPNDDLAMFWLATAYSKAERPYDAARTFRLYEQTTRDQRAREITRMRVAQIEDEIDQIRADSLATLPGTPPGNTFAVVKFLNNSSDGSLQFEFDDTRYRNLSEAAPTLLSSRLKRVGALDVIEYSVTEKIVGTTRDQVASLLDAGGSVRPPQGLRPVFYRVFGTMRQLDDDRIEMGAILHADASGQQVLPTHEGSMDEFFQLSVNVTQDILAATGFEASPEEQLAMGVEPERSLELFLAYGEGLYYRNNGASEEAAAAFAQAARTSPGFAAAARQFSLARATQTVADTGTELSVPAPPAPPSAVDIRTAAVTAEMGLGLSPDQGSSEASAAFSAETSDVTTVRGEATIRVLGRAGGQR